METDYNQNAFPDRLEMANGLILIKIYLNFNLTEVGSKAYLQGKSLAFLKKKNAFSSLYAGLKKKKPIKYNSHVHEGNDCILGIW